MLHRDKLLMVALLSLLALSPSASAEVIDRIVAVVDHQIITLSDVKQARKFLEIGPGNLTTAQSSPGDEQQSQFELTQKLIEQSLIRQQIQQFPGIDVSPAEIEKQMASLKKESSTSQDWEQHLEQLQLTPEEVEEHLRWQLQVMKFFDYRFRQFAVVDTREIEGYYREKFLPELAARGIEKQPSLAEVEEKIRGILTEEKVNLQIDAWLKSLKESASIEIFD
jgi:peptidyl-prolyl cis-trans isomerase SurA